MLVSVTLENFLSFGSRTKIDLNPGVNLLVGINGSGKSNLLKAFQFLQEFVSNPNIIEYINKQFGGIENLVHANGKKFFELTFEFDGEVILSSAFSNDVLKSELELVEPELRNLIYKIKIGWDSDKVNTESKISIDEILAFKCDSAHIDKFVNPKSPAPPDAPKLPTLFSAGGHSTFLPLPKSDNFPPLKKFGGLYSAVLDFGLSYTYWPSAFILLMKGGFGCYDMFDVSLTGDIRKPQTIFSEDRRIFSSGENLYTVLRSLSHTGGPDSPLATIEKNFKQVNPRYKGYTVTEYAGLLHLHIQEEGIGKDLPVFNLSDGTLRYLLLNTILHGQRDAKFITLDEPETGLHPDMISTVADGINAAAKNGCQVIVATHSPLLLNCFEPDDVLVFEKDQSNQTIVKLPSADELGPLAEGTRTGNLWLRGIIGGKRW